MIVSMGPLNGVTELREKHRYNITPWTRKLSDDDDTDTDDDEKLAVAAAMFDVPQRDKKGFLYRFIVKNFLRKSFKNLCQLFLTQILY